MGFVRVEMSEIVCKGHEGARTQDFPSKSQVLNLLVQGLVGHGELLEWTGKFATIALLRCPLDGLCTYGKQPRECLRALAARLQFPSRR